MIKLPLEILQRIISYTGNGNLYVNLFGKIPASNLSIIESVKLSKKSLRYCEDILNCFSENNVKFCARLYSKFFSLKKWEKCLHIYLMCYYHFSGEEKEEFIELIKANVTQLSIDLGMYHSSYVEISEKVYLCFSHKKDFIKFFMYVNFSRYDRKSYFFADAWVSRREIILPFSLDFNEMMEYFKKNIHVEKVNRLYYSLMNDFTRELYIHYLCSCNKCVYFKQSFREKMRDDCVYMRYFV